MREDHDEIRYYVPVVRRLVILAAVIIAVPVVMWTITGFVRTYMGPVRPPTIQTMLAAPVAPEPDQTATIQAGSAPASASVDPKATQQPPALPMNAAANAPSGSQSSAGTSMAVASSVPVADKGPVAAPPAPVPAAGTTGNVAMSNPATGLPPTNAAAPDGIWPAPPAAPMAPPMVPPIAPTAWATPVAPVADALPQSEPIVGPVPLPRKRPHSFVVAQAGIPMPRPRPAPSTAYTVTPAADEAPTSSPFGWLLHLFQPSSPAAASGTQEDFSGAH